MPLHVDGLTDHWRTNSLHKFPATYLQRQRQKQQRQGHQHPVHIPRSTHNCSSINRSNDAQVMIDLKFVTILIILSPGNFTMMNVFARRVRGDFGKEFEYDQERILLPEDWFPKGDFPGNPK